MTFLMHAARGYPGGTEDRLQKEQARKKEKEKLWKKKASDSLGKGDEDDDVKDLALENYSSAQENELAAFKVAWALMKETLWKEQVCIGFEMKAKQASKTIIINCVQEGNCSPRIVDTRYIFASSR